MHGGCDLPSLDTSDAKFALSNALHTYGIGDLLLLDNAVTELMKSDPNILTGPCATCGKEQLQLRRKLILSDARATAPRGAA